VASATLELLIELRPALPRRDVAEIDAQPRAVLHHLIDRAERFDVFPAPVAEDAGTCPNCGEACSNLRSPYCSDECKELSALIRQLRQNLLTGTLHDPEKQSPLGQKLWRLLGGGLPARVAMVQGRTLARVIEKKGGVCEICGQPATVVDNIGGG